MTATGGVGEPVARERLRLSRLGPPLAMILMAAPILMGLAGTVIPALGYLPALGRTDVSLAPVGELLAQPGIGMSVALSFLTGLTSTAIALGVTALFIAAFAGTRLFARVQHLISPLLAVPHAAAAFGLAFLIAPSGFLVRLVSPWATGWDRPPDLLVVNDPMGLTLVAGLVVKEIPFLLLVSLAALPQLDLGRGRMLAASLGYGRIAGILHGTWPLLYRQIRLAVFAVVAFATSVVDVAMILGPTTPPTLAVRLVGWMGDPDLSMRFMASAGALLQLGVTAAALLAWIGLEHAGARLRDRAALSGRRFQRDRVLRGAGLSLMLLSAAAILFGLGVLALWSVAGLWQFPDALPEQFTAQTWARAIPRLWDPLATTLLVALLSTLVAVFVVVLCLRNEDNRRRRAGAGTRMLIYLPLIVPQAAFLFGLQLLFLATGTVASLGALVAAHIVFVLPYVFLSLSDPWRAYDRRYEAVAAGLGKSRLAILFRVRLPMLLPAILTAAAVGFAVSIGLYLPTVLVGAGRLPTITTEAVALASGGNRRVIGVYAFLQMMLPAAGFAVALAVPALLWRHRRARA